MRSIPSLNLYRQTRIDKECDGGYLRILLEEPQKKGQWVILNLFWKGTASALPHARKF